MSTVFWNVWPRSIYCRNPLRIVLNTKSCFGQVEEYLWGTCTYTYICGNSYEELRPLLRIARHVFWIPLHAQTKGWICVGCDCSKSVQKSLHGRREQFCTLHIHRRNRFEECCPKACIEPMLSAFTFQPLFVAFQISEVKKPHWLRTSVESASAFSCMTPAKLAPKQHYES